MNPTRTSSPCPFPLPRGEQGSPDSHVSGRNRKIRGSTKVNRFPAGIPPLRSPAGLINRGRFIILLARLRASYRCTARATSGLAREVFVPIFQVCYTANKLSARRYYFSQSRSIAERINHEKLGKSDPLFFSIPKSFFFSFCNVSEQPDCLALRKRITCPPVSSGASLGEWSARFK